MDPYIVVSALVPEYTGTPTSVQLDAPAGYAIVYTFSHILYKDDPQPTDRVATYLTDAEDRIVSAVFAAEEAGGGLDHDFTGYAVCVPIDGQVSGVNTLSAGVAAVSAPSVTSSSRIFVQRHAPGGIPAGSVYEVTARTPGTGFTITAQLVATGLTNALDTSQVAWFIVEL